MLRLRHTTHVPACGRRASATSLPQPDRRIIISLDACTERCRSPKTLRWRRCAADRAEHVNVAALAREWGWTRDKVRQQIDGWRQNGDLPPAPKRRTTKRKEAATPADAPSAPAAASPSMAVTAPANGGARHLRRVGRLLGAAALAGVGVVLAAIGMVETTAFAARVGGPLFAALAICADALVLLMPAAVAALWRRRSPGAIAAAALWPRRRRGASPPPTCPGLHRQQRRRLHREARAARRRCNARSRSRSWRGSGASARRSSKLRPRSARCR